MKNKSFGVLAAAVDTALQHYREAETRVQDLSRELEAAREERKVARDELDLARDSMFDEFPELAPVRRVEAADADKGANTGWVMPGPGAFTPVEVDDPDIVPDFGSGR